MHGRRIVAGLITGAMALSMVAGVASIASADIGAPPVEHSGFAPQQAYFNGSSSSDSQFAPDHAYFNSGNEKARNTQGLQPLPTTSTGTTQVPIALLVGLGVMVLAAGLAIGRRRAHVA
jgi:LPXTG-motif cell wall-anchored protein